MKNSDYQKELYQAINEFRQEVNTRFDRLEKLYVTRMEFEPVKALVYGIVALILIGTVGVLGRMILSNPII